MRLNFCNIGPFVGNNDIDIDGITILAGVNGSGKSSCGKLLYCIFNCFQNIEERVITERKKAINNYLRRYIQENSNLSRINLREISLFTDRLLDDYDFGNYEYDMSYLFKDSISQDLIDKSKQKIIENIKLDDSVIRNHLLDDQIDFEFGNQIRNFSVNDEPAYVSLFVKNRKIAFSYDSKGSNIIDFFSIIKSIYYFDDPNILDNLDPGIRLVSRFDKSHQNVLFDRLYSGKNEQVSSVDQILIQNKISIIEDKLNTVCDGDITKSDRASFCYLSDEFKDGLNICNMATGLKTFALLKILLKNGCLEENGTVIFDEPEIHLHPEWQKVWAEIIVLLNKYLSIHVLLSTHSSDFLGFLEYYTKKYELKKVTRLYSLEKNKEGYSQVVDVTNEWDRVYRVLGLPFINISKELDSTDEY